ncbi:hypothetical protein [Streptomyces spongiae]|uniref:Spore-associated protein A n=1 Tax=Streptomyces spongiae TaxID=565072 RepID=A0A5N8XY61_9ACTN|nr:hypothetical protein [Streptomyces spongiae]MPY64311.1 hypothetical protein [Streptomyces spongiae]
MKKAIVAGTLALASAATCMIALAPAASAAPDACVTSTLTTGGREGVGTIVRKSSTSTCSDLNLTYADDKTSVGFDQYAGRLRNSSGVWDTCNAGYIGVSDGTYPVDRYLPCTDVLDNTPFTVASYFNGGDTVRIVH